MTMQPNRVPKWRSRYDWQTGRFADRPRLDQSVKAVQ